MKITKTVLKNRVEYRNVKGQYHREDGPAVEYANGNKEWFVNGKRHREDGPAIEWADGDKLWYLNDINMSEEDYWKKLSLMSKVTDELLPDAIASLI